MADLIDRQAAIDRINKQREHLQPDIYPQDEIGNAAYRICAEFIERLPSADVQPVRHGHWVRTGRTNVYGGFEVKCSVCNDSVMITNIEYEHYCRNCGARMDGENNG